MSIDPNHGLLKKMHRVLNFLGASTLVTNLLLIALVVLIAQGGWRGSGHVSMPPDPSSSSRHFSSWGP